MTAPQIVMALWLGGTGVGMLWLAWRSRGRPALGWFGYRRGRFQLGPWPVFQWQVLLAGVICAANEAAVLAWGGFWSVG